MGVELGTVENRAGAAFVETLEHRRLAAFRYRKVREILQRGRQGGSAAVIPSEQLNAASSACAIIDRWSHGWLSAAKMVLNAHRGDDDFVEEESARRPLPPFPAKPEDVVPERHAGTRDGVGRVGKGVVHVLVTNGELVPTVAKLLLFDLAR